VEHLIESDAYLYVITELLPGGSLLERVNQAGGLSLEKTRSIMQGVMAGLSYLHKYGIMHRDIKLENIMLRSADSWEPVLVDFGLAAISDDEPYINYRCGTPGYIAP
jgi:serine/threonine protein kinase